MYFSLNSHFKTTASLSTKMCICTVSVMFIVFMGSFVRSAKDFISFFIIISTEDDFKLFDY